MYGKYVCLSVVLLVLAGSAMGNANGFYPCPQDGTLLDKLGIQMVDPIPLGNDDCTLSSDGLECQVPEPNQKICSLYNLPLYMDQPTVDWVFSQLFPCGSGSSNFTLCASSETPPPGRYVCLIAQFEGDIPLDDQTNFHQLAFVFDADGDPLNNFEPLPDFPNDSFADTDLWYGVASNPGIGWEPWVIDVRQDYAQVQSAARFIISGSELAVLIPIDEFDTETPTFRVTAFLHPLDFGMDWSGDYHPLVGEPLLPVAGPDSVIVVEPPQPEASNPYPADGATDVATDTILSWTPGINAASHDVHFGTSSPPVFVGNQMTTSFDPGPLELSTTYYWQIDEVEADGTTKYTGSIWRFTAADYLPDQENIAPIPVINPVGPEIGGFVRLSAVEENSATDVSYCTFSYYDGNNWVEIGTDFGTVVDSDIKLGEWSAILDTSDVSPGDCRIQAYMEDDLGLSGTDEILVTVGLTPVPVVEVLEYDPDLGFTVLSAGGSFDPDGTITDYNWTFWTYPDIQTFTGDTIDFNYPSDYENVTFTLTLIDDMDISTSITGWVTEWLVELRFALEVQEIDRKKNMLDSIITEKQDLLSDMPPEDPGYNRLEDAIFWVDSAKEWLDLARQSLVIARDWHRLDDQTREMESLNNSRLRVDEAINNLRDDAIPDMRSVKDATTEATLRAKLEANIEQLELIMLQLHGLSGKLWLLHQIGPLTHGFDISIPSVLRSATYPSAGGGTESISGTHYADSDAIGITYCNESIVIQPSDTNDPDVFLHELDHHFMHKKDGYSLPGGPHSIRHASNNILAWSEGWATFSAAAKQNKSSYHDGEPGPNDDIEQNLEDNTIRVGEKNAWTPIPQAANVEGAISGLLWDLFDGVNTEAPESDNVNIPFKLIWRAINKSSDPTPPQTFARDIHEFYEHLMNLINNDAQFAQYKTQIPSINQVFTSHNVPKP